MKSIDDFKGNVTTKVLKKEIPFINDINKIKRIIQEWDEKKKKVDKYNKKISKLKKEIDKEVYNLYELDDKHINIIEKSIETHN